MPGNRQSMVSLTVDKVFVNDLIVYDCDVMGIEDQIHHQSTLAPFFFGCTLNHLTTEQWS